MTWRWEHLLGVEPEQQYWMNELFRDTDRSSGVFDDAVSIAEGSNVEWDGEMIKWAGYCLERGGHCLFQENRERRQNDW
jgi:hypothetical protein